MTYRFQFNERVAPSASIIFNIATSHLRSSVDEFFD
jgi:hypothetical protein